MPLLEADTLLGGRDGGQDFGKVLLAVQRKLNGGESGVKDPTKDRLQCAPQEITLVQFLDRNMLATGRQIVGIKGSKDRVDGMHQDSPDSTLLGDGALGEADEVVDKYVDVPSQARSSLEQVGIWVFGDGDGMLVAVVWGWWRLC